MKQPLIYRLIKGGALLAFFCLSACSQDDTCRKERVVAMKVDLYQTVFDAASEAFVSREYNTPDLTVYGVGNDSILYKNVGLKSFTVPLRKMSEQTDYVLINVGKSDTLTVYHTNSDNFFSLECGCVVFHTITDVESTTHSIDSVVVMNPSVTNVQQTNLRVYYREL